MSVEGLARVWPSWVLRGFFLLGMAGTVCGIFWVSAASMEGSLRHFLLPGSVALPTSMEGSLLRHFLLPGSAVLLQGLTG